MKEGPNSKVNTKPFSPESNSSNQPGRWERGGGPPVAFLDTNKNWPGQTTEPIKKPRSLYRS